MMQRPVPDEAHGAEQSCDSQPLRVTLVHGTWGKRSSWAQSGSPLWAAFLAEGAECYRFAWSGRNSHRARIQAAQDLDLHLQRLAEPGIRQAVVAHSHGGNAAVHAVWGIRSHQQDPITVVTMATPYFFAKRKGSTSLIDTAMIWIGAFILAFGVLPLFGRPNPWSWVTILPYLLIFSVAVLVVGAIYFRVVHGPSDSEAQQEAFIASVQTPPLMEAAGRGDLLVIRAADDEAGGLLGAAQFAGWLGLAAARLAKPSRIILLIMGVFTVSDLLLQLRVNGTNPGGLLLILRWSVPVMMAFLVLVAVPAIASLAQGWDGPRASNFGIVTAEASPPGDCTIWQRAIRDASASGLAHSSLYDDPEVVTRVVKYVMRGDGHSINVSNIAQEVGGRGFRSRARTVAVGAVTVMAIVVIVVGSQLANYKKHVCTVENRTHQSSLPQRDCG
jgi:hypothetical protein